METIFIENYRGKDIFYSPSKEKFYADIDQAKEKNGIHLVRKDIDEYIKENMSFKPFVAFNDLSFDPQFNEPKISTIIGIRKDKALQCDGGSQISNYDLDDSKPYSTCNWFVLNTDIEKTCLESIKRENELIKELEAQIKVHKENIKRFVNEMKGESLADFRRRILGENKQEQQ
jgi:hypothetical protein